MGYMRHHSIAVTSWKETITEIHEEAKKQFGELVSEIIFSPWNGYKSFFIAPDGSKEGWDESIEYDVKRHNFIKYLSGFAYGDGSSSVRYCEYYWSDDDKKCGIINFN